MIQEQLRNFVAMHHHASKMNRDILYSAVKNANIGYLSSTVDVLGKGIGQNIKDGMVHDRLNPITYFGRLTRKPKEILRAMDRYNVVLSGSRAAGYFSPELCTPESDWDFYTAASGKDIIEFIKVLNRLDIDVDSVDANPEVTDFSLDYNNISHVIRMSCASTGRSIQLMVCFEATVMAAVLGFDISAVQCIITGRFAVSLYHNLTRDMKAVFWSSRRIHESTTQLRQDNAPMPMIEVRDRQIEVLSKRRDKYVSRGLVSTEYRAYHGALPDVPFSTFRNGKLRSLGDEACGTIKFKKYGLPAVEEELMLSKYLWRDTPYSVALANIWPKVSYGDDVTASGVPDVRVSAKSKGSKDGIIRELQGLQGRFNESEMPL